MELQLLEWSYRNIRGVQNLDVKVTTSGEHPYPVSLIMMPNGVGKTTTMRLLRAVFDGSAERWDRKQVRDLCPPGTEASDGEFRAKFRLKGLTYVVFLRLDYVRGLATYMTSRVGDQGGLDEGLRLPSEATKVFTPDFVKRFVFDGELAKDILSSNKEEAENAIKYLYKLDRLAPMARTVDRLVEEEQQGKTSAAKTAQGIARLTTERDNMAKRLQELKDTQAKQEHEHAKKQQRLNETLAAINEKIKEDADNREKIEALEKRKAAAKAGLKHAALDVLERMRNPYALSAGIASRLETLVDNMQKLRLPKTMSSQFFEELAEQAKCVCGNDIGPKEKQHILHNAEKYLAEDQIAAINMIKSALRNLHFEDGLSNAVDTLQKWMEKLNRCNRDWDLLQAELEQNGDEQSKALKAEEEKLRAELSRLEAELQRLTVKDEAEQARLHLTPLQNIPLCDAELAERQKRLDEATGTVELKQKADRTRRLIEEIQAETLRRLKEKILQQTNAKLADIIETESIEVEAIDGHIILKNKSGGSEGQSLAIAYSFLGSMFEGSAYTLPFIVDSPAGSLDLDVRRNVAPVLPELFHQVIVFITSGERRAFADHFYTMPPNQVQFLTIAKKPGQDAQCTHGIEAFKVFQEETLELAAEEVTPYGL